MLEVSTKTGEDQFFLANMRDWNSKHYTTYALTEAEAALEIKDIFLKGGERVLDIGCGDGKITCHLAKKLPEGEAIGIDISTNMLQQAKEDYASIPNLHFFHQSADAFSFDKPFELIVSFACLHWVKHQDKVLQCVRSMLKRRGRIYFNFLMHMNPYMERILQKSSWKSLWSNYGNPLFSSNLNQYKQLLISLGFQCHCLEVKEHAYYFSNREEATHSLMTYLPYLTGLQDHLCHQIADEIITLLPRQIHNKQKKIVLAYDILHLDANLI